MTRAGEAEAYFAAGVQRLDAGDPDGAESELRRALELQPGSAETQYKLANACKELGKLAEAERHYRGTLALDPGRAEAHNNLGATLQLMERPDAAQASYGRAIALKPELPQPYLNLGRLLQQQGKNDAALACYAQALERGVEPEMFQHLFDAARGERTAQAPPAYVRATFDGLARQFDRHLVDTLDYHIPEMLSNAVRALSPPVQMDILDLGCGTGLCGEHMRDLARHLVGVDLAPNMLEMARGRACYHELVCAEIGGYLSAREGSSFDLVVAADVLIYIGDIKEVFSEVTRVLRPLGWFAFSIEQPSQTCESYRLEASGRYAQSLAYVRELAGTHGLAECSCSNVAIRKHGAQVLPGQLLVLKKC
ncbi:MAG: methyltransferase domain-containing protein [Burkholderiales bacterium]|nr:methyltransferase domain-containing protein [Burkholderiales bacterium]